MIPVLNALAQIEKRISLLAPVNANLEDAFGAVLAEDLFSPIDLPPFRNSAMDGYAIILDSAKTFKLVGEYQAGTAKDIRLRPGEAARVFTGSAIPENADTVVMQERVNRNQDQIEITEFPPKYANIRNAGEQVKKSELVLEKGTVLNEAAIGLLAGLGINQVKITPAPRVAILVTGNELQEPGEKLLPGCIYESNSVMLKMALRKAGVNNVEVLKAKDKLTEITEKVKEALGNYDVLLISGGISVGDYDFVKEALQKNQVEEIFYKVKQKPGKPLWFGKKQEKSIFALPGNPASSLSCFFVYVLPALRKLMGKKFSTFKKIARASEGIKNNSGKSLFLKVRVQEDRIKILDGQSSSMLQSFALSNALAWIPEDIKEIPPNGEVTYFDLNF